VIQSDRKATAPASSARNCCGGSTIRIGKLSEPGPKTKPDTFDSEDAEQWEEAIGKEVLSMECHRVFACVERPPEDARMIESRCVMRWKHLADDQTERRNVRLVGHGDHQTLGDYNDSTSPVIDSASVRLILGLGAT
jgi:hypothetical protein